MPISTTASATATASAAGTTVSFPDRFRTAQAYFAPKFEIECVHAWILTLITRLATTLSTTTPAATAPPLPLVHLGISAFAFKSNWHESRWRVRNQSETSQKPGKRNLSLSLPCLFPHPPTRTPTPTPMPISTTTTASATATASAAGTTVSFPDRFRTAQAYFAPTFEIECVHAWILTLITRFATNLSTTTTPAATAPPLPLVHLGISAFAFKSNWHESRWRVRNQSETRQKPAKRNHLFPPSLPLSLSLSLFPSLSLSSLALLLELLLLLLPPTLTPTTTTTSTTASGTTVSFPDRFRTAQAYFAPKFEIERVHAWILTLITRLATTLSTTTTPAATAPPLPLVHLGISAFAFKSNWHEAANMYQIQQKSNDITKN